MKLFILSRAVFLLIGINDLWNFSSIQYITENIIKIAEKIKNWITKNKNTYKRFCLLQEKIYPIKKINNMIKSKSSAVIDLHSHFVKPMRPNKRGTNNSFILT